MLNNRFNFLLAVVVAHLVVLGLNLPHPWTDVVNLASAAIASFLLLRITGRREDAWIMLALGCAGPVLNLLVPWSASPATLNLVKLALWCGAPTFLAQRVFVTIYDADAITPAEIAGAISVYLLLALIFANLYEALYVTNPRSIAFGANFAGRSPGFGEMLYFSFITLSTLGFGDVAPAHPVARIVVVVESVTGVMYMAILVARFVSLHSADRLQQRNRRAAGD